MKNKPSIHDLGLNWLQRLVVVFNWFTALCILWPTWLFLVVLPLCGIEALVTVNAFDRATGLFVGFAVFVFVAQRLTAVALIYVSGIRQKVRELQAKYDAECSTSNNTTKAQVCTPSNSDKDRILSPCTSATHTPPEQPPKQTDIRY